ncbi:hypothetical protein NQ317_012997 [Molorchus minor]|uniref:Uncharacterized protein n=1 Tax=Molorchus minor TaxID=1323400 RepID=A0ABQ9J8L3_9CUCU|nr:hypothetical protein NQ317_012997 [Molorchus minor]
MNDSKVDSIHIAHSTENVNSIVTEEEEQKKRERIEKYKEERRRVLQDKYRSESFKEDKDVLMNRLRIFKQKDETVDIPKPLETDHLPRSRRRSHRNSDDSGEITIDSLDEDSINISKSTNNSPAPKEDTNPLDAMLKKEMKPMKESLKSRAAIFEQNNQRISAPADLRSGKNRSSFREQTNQTDINYAKNIQATREKIYGKLEKNDVIDLKDLDFIRSKRRDDDLLKEERRRHTYDSRERESETDRSRRISVDSRSPRKEKHSPPYCIKDMKAIFESKSKHCRPLKDFVFIVVCSVHYMGLSQKLNSMKQIVKLKS